jgi:hypothetical protein
MPFDTAESEGLVDRKRVRSWESNPFFLILYFLVFMFVVTSADIFGTLVFSC